MAMMSRYRQFLWWVRRRAWLVALMLAAGCSDLTGIALVTVTPTSFPATPTPLPSPTATPTRPPTATPIPTPDPAAVRAIIERGYGQVLDEAAGATLLCLHYRDTNADGSPEWLAVIHQTQPTPRLSAWILKDDQNYPLDSAPPEPGRPDIGLGQYPTCAVEIRDLNANGMPEIAIFGQADDNLSLLHLYSWDGSRYRRLGYFTGNAGIRLMQVEGDLAEQIWVGYRVQTAPELAWYTVHAWRDGTYGWTTDRYDWYYATRPVAYPTHQPEYTVISFYLALNDRDLPGAYRLLAPQAERTYESWALGFDTTMRVGVGGVHTIPASVTENSVRVAAMVTAWDNEGGIIMARQWNVEWSAVRTEEGWRLLNASAELLQEWPVPLWP